MKNAVRLTACLVVLAAPAARALSVRLAPASVSAFRPSGVAALRPAGMGLGKGPSFAGLSGPLLAPTLTSLNPAPVAAPGFSLSFGLSAGGRRSAVSPLLDMKGPSEIRLKALFDGGRALANDGQDWGGSLPTPGSGKNVRSSDLYWPTRDEDFKIRDSQRRSADRSAIADDLARSAREQGVRVVVDRAGGAYHGEAYADGQGPKIALTVDTLANGSWAFIASILAREQTLLHPWYADMPASVEKLAVAYANMAMVFAKITDSSARSWATNLDHNHRNEGTYFVWAWYEQLLKAARARAFIETDFFTWLRDFTAKQVSDDASFQFSLYERYTGQYWRPGKAEHQQPIPDFVPRLDQAAYDAASRKIYGENGEGDDNSKKNFLGFIREFFHSRGNI